MAICTRQMELVYRCGGLQVTVPWRDANRSMQSVGWRSSFWTNCAFYCQHVCSLWRAREAQYPQSHVVSPAAHLDVYGLPSLHHASRTPYLHRHIQWQPLHDRSQPLVCPSSNLLDVRSSAPLLGLHTTSPPAPCAPANPSFALLSSWDPSSVGCHRRRSPRAALSPATVWVPSLHATCSPFFSIDMGF